MTAHADTALELLEYIDRSGGQVWLEGERLRYRLPNGHGASLERLTVSRDAVRDVLRSRTAKPRPAATLEPRVNLLSSEVWSALHATIPEVLAIITEDAHRIAWLEYRTPHFRWISTHPVTASYANLERLVSTEAAHEPKAVIAAIKSARGLNPDINPARQEVAQRARFSRKEVTV